MRFIPCVCSQIDKTLSKFHEKQGEHKNDVGFLKDKVNCFSEEYMSYLSVHSIKSKQTEKESHYGLTA